MIIRVLIEYHIKKQLFLLYYNSIGGNNNTYPKEGSCYHENILQISA